MPPTDRRDLAAWLRLAHTPGVGRAAVRQWLAAFGDAPAVLAASPADLIAVAGPAPVSAWQQGRADAQRHADATLAWLEGGDDRHVLTLADAAYPQTLLETADPPNVLHAQGRMDRLHDPLLVAVVGSRKPSPQGREWAWRFGRGLAEAGCAVVSGLAAGVDAQAHRGALAAGDGRTIAVVGTGLDRCYPAANAVLVDEILSAGGLLLSEHPPGTPPLAAHFPQRNRVIAGLAGGTLIVEAAMKSGSLITARLASEAGRQVFALPGPLGTPEAEGCHWLIREGATLVTSVDEVMEDLRPGFTAAAPRADGAPGARRRGSASRSPPLSQAELPPAGGIETASGVSADVLAAMEAMGHAPTALDQLVARTGWPAPRLLVALTDMELAGLVRRLPGGLFLRSAQG